MAGMLQNFEKGGGSPIITSGLGLSWVMVPLGPWSLGRGRGDSGWQSVTPCARSAVADFLIWASIIRMVNVLARNRIHYHKLRALYWLVLDDIGW